MNAARYLRVATLDDVPIGEGRQIRVGGTPIALVRISETEVRAVHGLCPHGNGPLADGILAGDQMICPLHGWRVALASGAVASASGPECSIPVYPVEVRGCGVFLDVSRISGFAARDAA